MMTKQKPTFEAHSDSKQFFIDMPPENEGEKGEKKLMRLTMNCVVVTTVFGDKVAFMKSSRGKTYRDSRGRKVVSLKDDGEKVTAIRPLSITESEVKEELLRLLDDAATAYEAFRALNVR